MPRKSSLLTGASLLLCAAAGYGQVNPNPKACGFLPIAQVESRFSAKAASIQGVERRAQFSSARPSLPTTSTLLLWKAAHRSIRP